MIRSRAQGPARAELAGSDGSLLPLSRFAGLFPARHHLAHRAGGLASRWLAEYCCGHSLGVRANDAFVIPTRSVLEQLSERAAKQRDVDRIPIAE